MSSSCGQCCEQGCLISDLPSLHNKLHYDTSTEATVPHRTNLPSRGCIFDHGFSAPSVVPSSVTDHNETALTQTLTPSSAFKMWLQKYPDIIDVQTSAVFFAFDVWQQQYPNITEIAFDHFTCAGVPGNTIFDGTPALSVPHTAGQDHIE